MTPLRWPRVEKINAGSLDFRVVNNLKDTVGIYSYPQFTTATPAKFSKAVLSIDKNRRNDIDVRYTFTFTNKHEIPNGSTFIITVPTDYNLITTTPAIRVSLPDFVNAGADAKLSSFFTSNKLQISNIGKISAGTTFSILLNGVKNPDVGTVLSSWYGEVTYLEFPLIRHPDFFSISLENSGSYSILNLVSLNAFPTNADIYARYTLVVRPTVKLSIGSEIEVQFPTQYKVIPTSPECEISGGMKTFTQCYQSLNSIIFVVDSDYEVTQGDITLVIKNMLNPDRGTTNSFEIYTRYDSSILERTNPANTTERTLTISNKPNSISIVDYSFDPQNEAEISTYEVTFVPTSNIDINQEIIFFFPDSFDQILGQKLQCKATAGLADEIYCNRLSNRILHIDGISSYQTSAARPITIQISGVINPNKLDSGSSNIGIGIKSLFSSSLIDYISTGLVISPIKAPGWAFFFDFISSNTKNRYTADYTLNFTAASSIPKLSSNGAVILDLPKQFNIGEEIVSCTSYTAAYGTALNCHILNNRVWITGNTNDYSGNLVVKVKKVKNPLDPIVSDNFVVSTYDGVNKKVIERSYENLDPFYKTYTYPGLLITVNNEQPITVMRGTQTDPIPIYIENIAALNLTLRPTTTGINIVPYDVDVQIGQQVRYFRISCPSDLALGNYTVSWTIIGELVPPIYTPIKDSQVQVITTSQLNVSIDQISDIPFGGTSMPVFFRISKAPDIGFNIIVNFKKNYQGITLSKNTLNFDAGVTEQYFRIYFTDIKAAAGEALTTGSLDLQVSGVNQALYTMPFTSITFKIITQDVIEPTISLLRVNSVQKTSVNFTIQTSEPCYVYYMVGLKGTKTPSSTRLSNLGANTSSTVNGSIDFYQSSTRASWHQAFIFENLTATLIVDKLNPQIVYTLYIVLQDRGSKFSTVTTQDFTTKDRDPAADVSIKLKQSYVSPYDANKFLASIALILSLDPSRVKLAKYDFTTGTANRRILAISGTGLETFNGTSTIASSSVEQVTTLLSFNIISTIDSELYPSPKILGQILNNKTIELAARIGNLDPTYIVPSTDFVKYDPNFVTSPTVYYYTYNYAILTTRMDNFGWLYAVAIESNNPNRSSSAPTTLQISMGVDSQNLPVPYGAIEISQKYTYFYLYLNDLKPSTKYAIYVIGANAHPGYPDLMNDKFIKKIDVTTLPAPVGRFISLS